MGIWNALPFSIQVVIVAALGAAAGALANVIVFACANSHALVNPWAPSDPPPKKKAITQVTKRPGWTSRIPIFGWLILRNSETITKKRAWLGPLLLEGVAAMFLATVFWFESNRDGFLIEFVASWTTYSLNVRLTILGLAGGLCGALANFLIYTQSHLPQTISPWGPKHDDASARNAFDQIPIVGWISMSREATIHGRCFWLRPLLIEIAMMVAFPVFYWWMTETGAIFPSQLRSDAFVASQAHSLNHIAGFHLILLTLMVAATFIDFDEKTIPDIITIPGTIIALIIATLSFQVYLPTALPVCEIPTNLLPTTFQAPWFQGGKWFGQTGLSCGLLIWTVWCFALADRRFSGLMLRRRGLEKTLQFFFAALFRHWTWKLLVTLWLAGFLAIITVWNLSPHYWTGLFTALVGLAAGGGTVWAIRIVASWAMNVEAMGFGDVTLMAMIGAFIGWQGAIAAFFLAPIAAVLIVLARYIVTRDTELPYGPYLCAGTGLLIVFWDRLYNGWLACNIFLLWDLLQLMVPMLLGLLALMLFLSRMIKSVIFASEED